MSKSRNKIEEKNKLVKKNLFKRRWYRLMMVASSIVVFCTTYALILPAITLEKGCKLEEHTHTEACYEDIETTVLSCNEENLAGHKHTKACKNADGEYICGYADYVLHTHDEFCYDEDGELICELEELEEHTHDKDCYTKPAKKSSKKSKAKKAEPAEAAHTHTDDCYTLERGELICTEEESDGHTHTDDCTATKRGELTCTEEESDGHTHGKSCYETGRECVCGEEESKGHTHGKSCYKTSRTLVCDDDSEEHEHDSDCYEVEEEFVCDKEESDGHKHTDACYEETETLVCDEEESDGHKHTDDCYERIETNVCGEEESDGHKHTDDCYEWERVLSCDKEETKEKEESEEESDDNEESEDEDEDEEADEPEEAEPILDCDEEEIVFHEHTDACFDADGNVICGKTQVLRHQHTEDCFTTETESKLVCTKEEHTHDASCTPKLETVEGVEEAAADKERTGKKTDEDIAALAASWETLTGDDAYVSSIEVTKYSTGTAPFDANDDAGNDSGTDNRIIRTFDTINYNITVKYAPHIHGDTFKEARVKMEFVLPVTADEAVFDQTSMGWIEDAVLKTETRDGTECQVLTCYKHLLPSAESTSVVPGEFTENVTVNVKMMNNGETIAPIFSAAMEYNEWDGECKTHEMTEKKSVTAEAVTVSAAPKYSILINPASTVDYKTNYDFSSAGKYFNKSTGTATALNQDIGVRSGRIFTYGVTLALYNDSVNKGLRGIALPSGDITFDIKLTSEFYPNYDTDEAETDHIAGTKTDVTDTYTPLVWSYSPQKYGTPDRDISFTSYTNAYRGAPHNKASENGNDRVHSCYDGGTWSMVQEGNVLHVTVKDYKFDGTFPRLRAGENDAESTYYTKATGVQNIGCFSAMKLYIVQPFQNATDGGTDKNILDDFSTDGSNEQAVGNGLCTDGTFNMSLSAINLKASSAGGQSLPEAPDDASNQTSPHEYDWHRTRTVYLRRPGNYELRHLYSYKDTPSLVDVFGVGETGTNTCSTNGNDWAPIGSTISLTVGGYAQTEGDEENKACAAKWLMKFDAEALEPVGAGQGNGYAKYYSYNFLYATKPDGANWTDDAEMKATTMSQLCYYETIEEAESHGSIVAYLVEAMPKGSYTDIPATFLTTYFCHNVKVRDDISLINRSFITTGEVLVWTVEKFVDAGESIPSLLGNDPSDPITLPKYTHIRNRPSTYQNGDGVYDKHTGSYTLGDTLLVVGHKATITKSLEQKTSESHVKETYNLDADQRVIDFVLAPVVKFDDDRTLDPPVTTTVTVTDTLPKYLTYHVGSAYFGGTYTQTSTNGGTLGKITGGTLNEPNITNNADGTQTLVWILDDVVIGDPIPAIHYAADIGSKGNAAADVPTGTTHVVNTAEITAVGDDRVIRKENDNYVEVGVNLVHGEASSYGKYSLSDVVEPDGMLDYVIYYDNNSATEIPNIYLLDTMPRNGYFGNDYTGSYVIDTWRLNLAACNPEKLSVYYTTDESYAGKTAAEISESEITSTWTKATMSDTTDATTYMLTSENSYLTCSSSKATVVNRDANGTTYLSDSKDPDVNMHISETLYQKYKCEDITDIIITASNIPNGQCMQLFWQATGGNNPSSVNEKDSMKLYSTGIEETEFVFHLAGQSGWSGDIKKLRLDPLQVTNTQFTIKSIRIITSLDGVITELEGTMPVAWAIIGSLGANQSISVDLSLQLIPATDRDPNKNDVFHNQFSHASTVTVTDERTVTRTLEGLCWLDANSNGLQDSGEDRLSGVSVALLKLRGGGSASNEADYEAVCYPGTTVPIVIQTGQRISVLSDGIDKAESYSEGRYLFTNLERGTYAVKFTSGTHDISPYLASPANRGGSDDTKDSDGEPTYNESKNRLLHTFVPNIVFPPAEKMSVARYEVKYVDSGFYTRGYELPSTGGSGTIPYTVGGTLLTAAALLLLYKKHLSKGGSSDL